MIPGTVHFTVAGDAATRLGIGGNQGTAHGRDTTNCRRHGNRHIGRHGSGTYVNAAGNRGRQKHGAAILAAGRHHAAVHPVGNDLGAVWALPAPPFWNTVPIEVPLRCIAAGCRSGGTVLDMFAGIATTGLAARELDRSFIGIEQTPDLCRIAQRRLEDNAGDTDGSARAGSKYSGLTALTMQAFRWLGRCAWSVMPARQLGRRGRGRT